MVRKQREDHENTIAFKADGEVSAQSLRTIVDALVGLVETITEEVDPKSAVEWIVHELEGGSIMIAMRGRSDRAEDRAVVSGVVSEYGRIGAAIQRGSEPVDWTPAVRKSVRALTSVLNGRIPRIKMTADQETWEIQTKPTLGQFTVGHVDLTTSIRTALRGTVETLSQKQGVYFTLREASSGRDIRCYPGREFKQRIGETWVNDGWVIVEGTYNRFTTQPTMTDITEIFVIAPAKPGDWKHAAGCSPSTVGESAAETIRRVRG